MAVRLRLTALACALATVSASMCQDVVLESEKGQGGGERQDNGYASGNSVTHIGPKSPTISFPFFTDKEGPRSLAMRYSNDGDSDDMVVTMDSVRSTWS